jgi:hypothetical protein
MFDQRLMREPKYILIGISVRDHLKWTLSASLASHSYPRAVKVELGNG